jgi:Fe-S-cluster containining protein
MLKPNNCINCPTQCCGKIGPVKAPVLIPKELMRFDIDAFVKDSKIKGLFRLKRKNGKCVFLKNHKCKIYDRRPIECKLYPWLLNWNGKKLTLQLHPNCPDKHNFEQPQIPKELMDIPESWWDLFMTSDI